MARSWLSHLRSRMTDSDSAPLASGPSAGEPRLLDRVRQAIRLRHYSRRTEYAYVAWIRRFVVFHGKRHPRDLGGRGGTAFLSSLPGRGGGASAHDPALPPL